MVLRHLSACSNVLVLCYILFLDIDALNFDIINIYLQVKNGVLTHPILFQCFFGDFVLLS